MSERVATSGVGSGGVGVTPLWAVLVFTFLSSLGTGLVTNGVFFITKHGLGFSAEANLGLALGIGVTYVVGAFFAGRVCRALRAAGVSSRGILVWMMVVLGVLACVPWAAQRGSGSAVPPGWSVWAMVLLYIPVTGVLWPLVESFLSGGRGGERLRSSLGVWNVVWSAALVVSYWAAAPLIKSDPALVLAGLGAVHVASLVVLLAFPREAGRHVIEGGHADGGAPESYRRLLAIFRVLLPTSYVVNSALGPILSEQLGRFPIDEGWQFRLAATWLVARPVTFLVLERWQGWHGSRVMPVVGAMLLVLGFAGSVAASRIDTGDVGLAIQVASLAMFGVGMATIYTGALYYAMAVGHAEVDAGGTHEALIGVGYTLGPLCGLAAAGVVAGGGFGPGVFEVVVIGLVSVVAVAGLVLGLRTGVRGR